MTLEELFKMRESGKTLGGEILYPKQPKKKKVAKKTKKKQTRKRLINKKAFNKYAQDHTFCEWCELVKGGPNELNELESSHIDPPHHIKYKSQGGPDIPENLVTLCNKHHTIAHNKGPKVRAFIFKEIKNINQNLIICWDPDTGLIKG